MVDTVTVPDVIGVSGYASDLVDTDVSTPLQLLCDIPCMEKSIHWICWIYRAIYWLFVDLPNLLTEWLGWASFIINALLAIWFIGAIILLILFTSTISSSLSDTIGHLHKEAFIRAAFYVAMATLMFTYHADIMPWWAAGTFVAIIAFVDGVGIIRFGFLGVSLWVGIGWAIIMVLLTTISLGMLFPFVLAVISLGPALGLPWDWFNDMFDFILGLGLLLFVIISFYPALIPGFESVMKIFMFIFKYLNLDMIVC